MPVIVGLLIIIIGVVLVFWGFMGVGAWLTFPAWHLSKGAGVPPPPVPPPVLRTPWDWWDIQYSEGCPPRMNLEPDGTYTFPLPNAPGSVHYVTTTAPAVSVGQTITMWFSTEGTGTILPVQGSDDPPAKIQLYLEQKGMTPYMPKKDDTKVVDHEMERWWSTAHMVITNVPGVFTLSALLNPDQWSEVYGRSGIDPLCGNGFANCLANLGALGFTFGGASFAGHGDYLEGGPATFRLKSYTVN